MKMYFMKIGVNKRVNTRQVGQTVKQANVICVLTDRQV